MQDDEHINLVRKAVDKCDSTKLYLKILFSNYIYNKNVNFSLCGVCSCCSHGRDFVVQLKCSNIMMNGFSALSQYAFLPSRLSHFFFDAQLKFISRFFRRSHAREREKNCKNAVAILIPDTTRTEKAITHMCVCLFCLHVPQILKFSVRVLQPPTESKSTF